MAEHPLGRPSLAISLVFAVLLLATGCQSGGGGLKSLTIDPPEVTMQSRGENIQLTAVGTKGDGSLATDEEMDLRWSYSDGSVASVDKSGLLRGVLAGEGTVTVKSEAYGTSATINVHVLPPKFTPEEMQAKIQAVIDAVKKFEISASTTDDQAAGNALVKDLLRHLGEAHKYAGQGTNNTLASVELLNAANFMEVFLPKAKGSLAEELANQSELTRQHRDDLFAY